MVIDAVRRFLDFADPFIVMRIWAPIFLCLSLGGYFRFIIKPERLTTSQPLLSVLLWWLSPALVLLSLVSMTVSISYFWLPRQEPLSPAATLPSYEVFSTAPVVWALGIVLFHTFRREPRTQLLWAGNLLLLLWIGSLLALDSMAFVFAGTPWQEIVAEVGMGIVLASADGWLFLKWVSS